MGCKKSERGQASFRQTSTIFENQEKTSCISDGNS